MACCLVTEREGYESGGRNPTRATVLGLSFFQMMKSFLNVGRETVQRLTTKEKTFGEGRKK